MTVSSYFDDILPATSQEKLISHFPYAMALTRVALSRPSCDDNIAAFRRAIPLPRSICYHC